MLGLHLMNSPATARNGNRLSAGGMAVAVLTTLALPGHPCTGGLSAAGWLIIIVGFAIGGGAGFYMARTVKMTAMPQLVSLFNAVGGGAAALVAIDDFVRIAGTSDPDILATTIFVVLGAVIGSVTFSGSLIAGGKLQGLDRRPADHLPRCAAADHRACRRHRGRPDRPGPRGSGTLSLSAGVSIAILILVVAAALIFGITMVLPIGGADMPVVISLLNSFTGTAAAMAGFVINNPVLIIAGALVGASGGILTKLMADAMNRSIMNIMVGGFGVAEGTAGAATGGSGTVREVGVDDAAIQLAYAQKVIIVPGYGLAVAQAQHAVRELAELLEARGVDVSYAIHPGRGPHARAHERAAGRGQRALSAAQGDGRDQP